VPHTNQPATTELPQAVFIAGCGRSGTSLLRTLLDAHPDVYIPSESLFIADYLEIGDRIPRPLLRLLLRHEPQLLCWYDEPVVLRATVAATVDAIHSTMARRYGARLWGQKTPRFIRYRQVFDLAFPHGKWILVYRDPRAVCASMRRSGQHTNSVAIACRRWLRDNRDILEFLGEPGRCPDNVLLVRYEDFIRGCDAKLDEIFDFLNLSSVPLANLVQNARPVFFRRSGFEINTVRDGVLPDNARIDDWRKILSEREISYIERVCGRQMDILGYDRYSCNSGKSFSLLKDFLDRISDVRIAYRYMRYWPTYPMYTLLRKLVLLPFRIFARV